MYPLCNISDISFAYLGQMVSSAHDIYGLLFFIIN